MATARSTFSSRAWPLQALKSRCGGCVSEDPVFLPGRDLIDRTPRGTAGAGNSSGADFVVIGAFMLCDLCCFLLCHPPVSPGVLLTRLARRVHSRVRGCLTAFTGDSLGGVECGRVSSTKSLFVELRTSHTLRILVSILVVR